MTDMAERLRVRLRQLIEEHDTSAWAVSKRAGLSEGTLLSFLRGASGIPRVENLERYANVFGLTLDDLYGDAKGSPPAPASSSTIETVGRTESIPVLGTVAAGVFMPIEDFEPGPDDYVIAARDPRLPRAKPIAFRVDGDSMNLRGIQPGDILLAVDFHDFERAFGRHLRDGTIIVAEQIIADGQLREWSVKEIHSFDDRIELTPRSTNPRHKPIVVPRLNGQDDGRTVRVKAVVTGKLETFEV